jgi:hypothetical protein
MSSGETSEVIFAPDSALAFLISWVVCNRSKKSSLMPKNRPKRSDLSPLTARDARYFRSDA